MTYKDIVQLLMKKRIRKYYHAKEVARGLLETMMHKAYVIGFTIDLRFLEDMLPNRTQILKRIEEKERTTFKKMILSQTVPIFKGIIRDIQLSNNIQ